MSSSLAEFPLTHRALVCSRMDMFPEMDNVNMLSTYSAVLPHLDIRLGEASEDQAKRTIEQQLPVFLHNLIRARDFPLQAELSVALTQMEQSISENVDNPIVNDLLTCGLRGEVFNAGGLPEKADAKRAVSLYLARSEWDSLYRTFTMKVVKTLASGRQQISRWIEDLESSRTSGESCSQKQPEKA